MSLKKFLPTSIVFDVRDRKNEGLSLIAANALHPVIGIQLSEIVFKDV